MQTLLGEKWEERWHTEKAHQRDSGLEQSFQGQSKQSFFSYLKTAATLLAIHNVISQ